MRPSVFGQSLREIRQPMLRASLGMLGAAALLMLAFPLLEQVLDLNTLADGDLFDFFFNSEGSLSQLSDWLRVVGFGFFFPAGLGVFAVRQGSWLVAGEEERGSLGLLLAAPVPRSRLVLEKFAVLWVALMMPVAALLVFLTLWQWVGVLTLGWIAAGVLNLFLLSLVFGSLALAVGCLTGRWRRTRYLGYTALVVAFVFSRLPGSFPGRMVLRLFSPFYYYVKALPGAMMGAGMGYTLVLLALALLCFGAAWAAFENRDLAL